MDYLIHHMLRRSFQLFPDKEALVHGNERLSYREVFRRTASLASSLVRLGIKRGERVGIYLDASVPQVLSMFSISMSGAVYVPINSVLFPNQVLHIANDCAISALIVSRDKLESLLPVLDQAPSIRFLIVVSEEPIPKMGREAYLFSDLTGAQDWAVPPDRGISKDLAAILYTSGSTGRP